MKRSASEQPKQINRRVRTIVFFSRSWLILLGMVGIWLRIAPNKNGSPLKEREAKIFQTGVAGTAVYDAAGNLRFYGGITGARGHVGHNFGGTVVASHANTGVSSLARAAVFGGPLFTEPVRQTP